jgi:thiol-disulfide isomerase/thioredoxin
MSTITRLPRRAVLRCWPLLAGVPLLGAPHVRAAAAPAQPGERVAWPEVALLDGQRFGPAEVAGRALVVVFFTTTCPFCRRHNRHLQRLHAQAPAGLAVLGVARESDAEVVRRHAAREGYR